MIRWLSICAWIALTATAFAEDPDASTNAFSTASFHEASAYVAADRVVLGRPFVLLIVVDIHDQRAQPSVSTALDLGTAFDVGRRFIEPRTRADGTFTVELQLELTPWRAGEQKIPPIPVDISVHGEVQRIYTPPTAVSVIGLLGDSVDATLRDIAPPLTVTRSRWHHAYWLAIGLATLLGFIGALWGYRRGRRKTRHALPEERLAPNVEALDALRSLSRSGALDSADPSQAFDRMFDIIRVYIGRSLNIPIVDATSRQLLSALRTDPRTERGHLNDLLEQLIRPWFATCDLVKFADARPEAADAQATHQRAIEIVERTHAAYLVPSGGD